MTRETVDSHTGYITSLPIDSLGEGRADSCGTTVDQDIRLHCGFAVELESPSFE